MYDSRKNGAGAMTRMMVKKSINHDVQRQPRVWVTTAPRIGPNAGPKNGVAT